MPAITFERFDGGLDVRQLASSVDANRLRTLKNAYVTTGRTVDYVENVSNAVLSVDADIAEEVALGILRIKNM